MSIVIVSAGTPDYRPMMDENRRRCESFGYRYVAHDLDPSSDLEGSLPPCTFKPDLILRSQPHQPFPYDPTPQIFAWLDGDCIAVKPLDELESIAFDVAVTLRPPEEVGTTQPTTNYLNAGVIFFRDTAIVPAFIRTWRALAQARGNDQAALNELVGWSWSDDEWRASYNHSHTVCDVLIHILPAAGWNWSSWDRPKPADARILHFKHGWRAVKGPQWWREELRRYDERR